MLWDISTITHTGELDTFWQNPIKPNSGAFQKLKEKIMSTQFNGAFDTQEGRDMLLPLVSEHITLTEQNTEELSREPAKREKNRRVRKKNRDNSISLGRKHLDLKV